jgi:hypothetical protein
MEAYGTGAGYGNTPHKYWTFKGVGITQRSVKAAVEIAEKNMKLHADYNDGSSWIPVLYTKRIIKDGKVICSE